MIPGRPAASPGFPAASPGFLADAPGFPADAPGDQAWPRSSWRATWGAGDPTRARDEGMSCAGTGPSVGPTGTRSPARPVIRTTVVVRREVPYIREP